MISTIRFPANRHLQHFVRYTGIRNYTSLNHVTIECDYDELLIHIAETYFNAVTENEFPS
jgi:hypothetical protein